MAKQDITGYNYPIPVDFTLQLGTSRNKWPVSVYLKWNGQKSERNEVDNKQRAVYSIAWKVIVIIKIQ